MYIRKPLCHNTCDICGTEFDTNKLFKNTCSDKCKKTQKRRKSSESYFALKAKPGKYACPDCGIKRSHVKYCYCKRCTEKHQRFGTVDTVSMECNVNF